MRWRARPGAPPIPLGLAGAGCFPNLDRPRVLWVGIGGDTAGLARLQRDVEAQLAGLGYRPEARAFSPHLTLARMRDTAMPEDLRRLGQAMRVLAVPATAFTAESVALIRSDLRPAGAVYTTLAALTLGGEATHPARLIPGPLAQRACSRDVLGNARSSTHVLLRI